jgi:hypothetical protein
MSRAIRDVESESVTASLQFSANAGQTPVAQVSQPGQGQDQHSMTTAAHDVVIGNARPLAE